MFFVNRLWFKVVHCVSSSHQGCMNNFTFGDANGAHYETIAGGAGAVRM